MSRMSRHDSGTGVHVTKDCLSYHDYSRDRDGLKPVFDEAVRSVEEGRASLVSRQGMLKIKAGGHVVYVVSVLEYFLAQQNAEGFDDDQAVEFTETMRRRYGWNTINCALRSWVDRTVRDTYFYDENTSDRPGEQHWVLRPDVDLCHVNPDHLRFAGYIAVSFRKYGQSFESLTTKNIFDWVTQLGSDLPAQMKKHGSGDLPESLVHHKDSEVTCTANDAFATIRIRVKTESEDNYRTVLTWLNSLLQADFPRSYSIDFRSPVQAYLPIKGLPDASVNTLFANAVAYPDLWPLIETYARLAMREDEWLTNLPEENPAMPGTFAVFALAMASDDYLGLAMEYMGICDGEHQDIQADLVQAYVLKNGFTPQAIALFLVCSSNTQHMPHDEAYPMLMANPESLRALAEARTHAHTYVWQEALHAIWGDDALNDPSRILAEVPPDLVPFYEAVLDTM